VVPCLRVGGGLGAEPRQGGVDERVGVLRRQRAAALAWVAELLDGRAEYELALSEGDEGVEPLPDTGDLAIAPPPIPREVRRKQIRRGY
jgi:hypothetical protein